MGQIYLLSFPKGGSSVSSAEECCGGSAAPSLHVWGVTAGVTVSAGGQKLPESESMAAEECPPPQVWIQFVRQDERHLHNKHPERERGTLLQFLLFYL